MRRNGFTVIELIMVVVMIGLLAVVALPRLQDSTALRASAWHDQVQAALRHARQTAVGHRRLVCATVATGSVTLTIASANPATSCNTAWRGVDGNAAWSRDAGTVATSVSPAGTIYFQPSGRITSDGAGTSALNASITIAGEAAIGLVGETGHVE